MDVVGKAFHHHMLRLKLQDKIIIGLLLLFLTYTLFRCNNWYRKLSGNQGKLTVAYVYDKYKIKGSTYYEYIYKVAGDYYTEATSGSNVSDLNSQRPQCFLLVYNIDDPTIHTVIYSYKLDTLLPLGANMDTLKVDKNTLVEKHTIGWNGLSPSASKNDQEKINDYRKLTGLNY